MTETTDLKNSPNSLQQEIPDSVYSGTEPFFSFFSQAQVGLGTLRLSLEDRIVSQTSDLASSLENTKRTFQHNGKVNNALQDVNRILIQLQQRIQSWEREVQNRERNKHGSSGGHQQRLKSEIGHVRVRAQGAERTMSKLQIVLYQMDAAENEAREAAAKAETSASEGPSNAPSVSAASVAPASVAETPGIESPLSSTSSAVSSDASSSFTKLLNDLLDSSKLQFSSSAGAKDADSYRERAWDGQHVLIVVGLKHSIALKNSMLLWLIPKSVEYSAILSKQSQQIHGLIASSSLPATSTRTFSLELSRADQVELPRSQSIANFVNKIIDKRFTGLAAGMNLLSASIEIDVDGPFEIRFGQI